MSSAPEIDFPYPDLTPGSDFKNNGGKYLRNLTEQNRAILQEMRELVRTENINLNDLSGCILDESLLLLRYLRANNFDIKKAKKQMLKVIEWRKAQNVADILSQSPEQILGCNMTDLLENFPHWHCGYDKTGRPLLVKQQGTFDMKAVKALCGGDLDRVFRYHIWEQELISRVCYEQSLKTRTIIETITVVLDVKGMTLNSLSADFRKIMSAMIKMDQDMYPETLGRILIINAPSAFPMIWAVMKPWFDPITAAKVKILGSDFQAKLHEHVGVENVPTNYGGTGPTLTKDTHPYADAMALTGAGAGTGTGTGNTGVSGLSSAVDSLQISGEKDRAVPVSVFTATTTASATTEATPADSPAPPAAATAAADGTAGGFKQRAFIYDD